ncbi:MAG TPA: hypothetical protein V6D23_14205 [Candidatus Obscuribacterales bacterium]
MPFAIKPTWKLALALILAQSLQGFTLVDEQGKQVQPIQASQYFSPAKGLAAGKIESDPAKLAAVARETLAFLRRHRDDRAAQAGLFKELNVTLPQVEATLEKVIATVAADTQAKRPQRILNPAFLEKEFRLLSWRADAAGARAHKVNLPDQRLRITKYVVFEAKGSATRSGDYCCVLYALPPDEAQLSAEQADARKDQLLRFKFTKQQVVAGALDKLGVRPLVWLTRQGLEDALLQGSLMVAMPDGSRRMFNVHRNNGIGYDRKIKDPRLQRRYWYFKEVKGIQGYGQDDKILIQPGVTFAGDVFNLGLGKLIAIRYPLGGKPVLRLGILADTGGAFIPNLYQLDYLSGIYPDRPSFQKGIASLPEFADTFVLIARAK